MRVSHGTYRGVIALVAIAGTYALAVAGLILYGDADLPAWSIGLTSTIVAFYFGERAAVVASRNGVANGDPKGAYAERQAAQAAAMRETDKQ